MGNITAHIVNDEIITTQATDLRVIERSSEIFGSEIVVTLMSTTKTNKALAATVKVFHL